VRVIWQFNQLALVDKHKFLKFAASIPRNKIPDLFLPIESGSFRESLVVLLRSCVAIIYSTRSHEDVHERSLLVCLHAIRHIVKAEAPTIPDLNFMKDHFANPGFMQPLWHDINNSIRITSRSICALVARQVLRKRSLELADRYWLSQVTGGLSSLVTGVTTLTMRDRNNFKSFVDGALPRSYAPYRDLLTEDATSFNETLAILLGIRTDGYDYFTTPDWQTRLSEEVGLIQRNDPQRGLEVFDRLRLVFPSLPPITSAHEEVLPPRSTPPPSPVLPSPREVPPPAGPLPSPFTVSPTPAIRPSSKVHRRHASI
jgi:hypothetical protein